VVVHRYLDAYGSGGGWTNFESSSYDGSLFMYTGRFTDNLTGLQWNLHRWYDRDIGRWMSEDPIGFGGDPWKLYRYVGNSPTSRTDPQGLFSIDRAAKTDNKPGPINPVLRHTAGARYIFAWTAPTDANLFVQRVIDSGVFMVRDETGVTHKVNWDEDYVEAWVNGARVRAGGNSATDYHEASPKPAAQFMERIGGFHFVQQGSNKLCMVFSDQTKKPRQVKEWSFQMKATFQVVNGDYLTLAYGIPAFPTFLGNSENTFRATASFDGISMDSSRFTRYLYPGRSTIIPKAFPPPVNNGGATSNDEWNMSWREGETKSTVRYSGQYR
jgi:RHS repeat-associated protein